LVIDADGGTVVKDASVSIRGYPETLVATERSTGAFKSFPLPVGDDVLELTVTAPSYAPYKVSTTRGKANETRRILVELVRDKEPRFGRMHGSVRSEPGGKPVTNAQIYVPQSNQKASTDAAGEFNFSVRTGHVDVMVSAPGFETQRRRMVLDEGDVIILNIDLAPHK